MPSSDLVQVVVGRHPSLEHIAHDLVRTFAMLQACAFVARHLFSWHLPYLAPFMMLQACTDAAPAPAAAAATAAAGGALALEGTRTGAGPCRRSGSWPLLRERARDRSPLTWDRAIDRSQYPTGGCQRGRVGGRSSGSVCLHVCVTRQLIDLADHFMQM